MKSAYAYSPAANLTVTTSPLRVLVVENDLDTGNSFEMVLSSCGYLVNVVRDRESALGAAATIRPDVVVMNPELPGLNAYEVAATVRARYRDTSIKIIVLTVLSGDHDAESSAPEAMFDHFVKPCDLDLLMALLAAEAVSKETKLRLLN